MDFEDISGLAVMALSIPGLYFVASGGKEGPRRYETDWDFTLTMIALLGITAEMTMFILKMVLLKIHLGWLPDLVVCWLIAIVCLRRSYHWLRLFRAYQRGEF